jgi:hypothetical protein
MKKNTVTTISIRSPIDLLLKVNASANMSSQAKCQRLIAKKLAFQGSLMAGRLQFAK